VRRPLPGTAVLTLAAGLTATLLAAPAALASPDPLGRTPVKGPAGKAVALTALGSYASDVFDASAAEIVAHDPLTQRLFVVNAASGSVDVLDGRDPTSMTLLGTLDTAGLRAADGSVVGEGAVVNSVAVRDGLLAVAVQAPDKVQPGWTAFFGTEGDLPFVSALRVGVLPDMVTFSPDGRTVLVANEGEPAGDFATDPEGSVSLVDVSGGATALSQQDVRTATFRAWDEGRALPRGVRVFGPDVAVPAGQAPAGRVARNLEPEYVTVDHDSATAYVSLQEANTIAVLDLASAQFTDLLPLGSQDWSAPGNEHDASDRDLAVSLRSWPVRALLLPDAIASYRFRGQTFLVTANEGDAREWGDYADVTRLGSATYPLCADAFPDAASLKQPANLGRLNVSLEDGRRPGADCFETVHVLGSRSFSIFTTEGERVFDSGGQIERLIAGGTGGVPPSGFNSNHTSNVSFDARSDDKGPEPEGVTVGRVAGRTYAFLGLERTGGVLSYDVTDPRAVTFVDYVNNRGWQAPVPSRAAGDLGTEGVTFVPADQSPTGGPLLLTANEVSGTTTAFAVERRR